MLTRGRFVAIAALLFFKNALGDVRLPTLISDNMVLQRDTPITLWGWAERGESVHIRLDGMTATTHADRSGHWSLSLGSHPAGGPYELAIEGRNRLVLHDVLIGDVWIASGQSNMEFPLYGRSEWKVGAQNAAAEVAQAVFPKIRLFKIRHSIAFTPADNASAESWVSVNPGNVGEFSAVAYLFGRELHQHLSVPIGLIEAAWGGTLAEAWMSSEGLRQFPEFAETLADLRQASEHRAKRQHENYIRELTQWKAVHDLDDRGYQNGRPIWADPMLDTSAWEAVVEPQTEPNPALKGFDQTVWFRKDIDLPENLAGRDMRVHLLPVDVSDSTFFNGEKIGETTGWDQPRDYPVSQKLVKAGRNVLVVRMTGGAGYVGMFGGNDVDKLNVESGDVKVPLAGRWLYRSGADLGALPEPSKIAKLTEPSTPSVLFNGMISPLTSYAVKGIIWYQGEANTVGDRAPRYRMIFPALIKDWREHWHSEVPFLFVQLAGFGHNQPEPADYAWAEVREAQSLALALPHTGMATAIDIGNENDIHPIDKQDVAHRLALVAEQTVYREAVVASGPTYQSAEFDNTEARIKLINLGSGLDIHDKYGFIRGFQIAGTDGKFLWAWARQDGNDILVFNRMLSQPRAVRYDWSNTPDGNVYNKDGLPMTPFRTDGPSP